MEFFPVIDMGATAQRIRQLREAAGLSISALQKEMRLPNAQTLYRWEYGKTLPSLDNFVVLAAALHCGLDDIIITRPVPAKEHRLGRDVRRAD